MFKRPSVAVFLAWCVCILFVPGCAGNSCSNRDLSEDPSVDTWDIHGPADLAVGAGRTESYNLTSQWKFGTVYGVNLTVSVARVGWTATITPAQILISDTEEPIMQVDVTVPAGEPAGTTAIITVKGRDEDGRERTVTTTATVTAAPTTTGLTKVADFAPADHGVQIASYQVSNGAPGALIGSMVSAFVPGTLWWYLPDNRLNMGPNTTADYRVAAIALDSTALGPFTIQAKFEKGGIEYVNSSVFTPRTLSDVSYRIQPISMNVSNTTIGSQANFTMTIGIPPGKAGTYSLTFQNVSTGLQVVADPASAVVGPAGGDLVFDVRVTRAVADAANGDKTHEIRVVGTHDSNPECNLTQVVPVYIGS